MHSEVTVLDFFFLGTHTQITNVAAWTLQMELFPPKILSFNIEATPSVILAR